MAVVAAAGTALEVGGKALNAIKGILGKRESPADLNKQRIQNELKKRGFPQFSKMSGFKGDEKAKAEAMATILVTVENYPGSARKIESWLSNGNITPQTISRIKSQYPLQSIPGLPDSQKPDYAITSSPMLQSDNQTLLVLGGGALAVAVIAGLIYTLR